jgi:hypothetical protein
MSWRSASSKQRSVFEAPEEMWHSTSPRFTSLLTIRPAVALVVIQLTIVRLMEELRHLIVRHAIPLNPKGIFTASHSSP